MKKTSPNFGRGTVVKRFRLLFVTIVWTGWTALNPAGAQGTAFTYQGRLNDGADPANGSYDLRFALYDALTVGNQVGSPLTNSPVNVSNGFFTVTLDFGNQFPGTDRWLEIGVRTNGGGAFTSLDPRQPVTPAPYSIYAGSAATLATTNSQPLNLTINGTNVLRITLVNDVGNGITANSVGGSPANVISNGVVGAFIGGGGSGLYPNRVGADYASVLGGLGNIASGSSSTAMGFFSAARGYNSTAIGYHSTASGDYATAMGPGTAASGGFSMALGLGGSTASGYGSTALGAAVVASGDYSTALGYATTASTNYATAMGYSTTASGIYATAMGDATTATNDNSTAMGDHTTASGVASTAMGSYTLSSGDYSIAMGSGTSASGPYSTAMGYNTAASSDYSTAMGRDTTASGAYSIAIGRKAKALQTGTFVWADSQNSDFASTRNNQFAIRAGGGVVMNVGSSGLNPAGVFINSTSANGVALYAAQSSSDAAVVIANSGAGDLIKAFNGVSGNPVFQVVNDGTVYSKGFALTSDRNAKEKFVPVDGRNVLAKIATLPLTEWTYKTDVSGTRHIGPMAQDFHAAFGLNGSDDKHISVVDESGVALAAIQGLNQKLTEELKQKGTEIAELKQRLERIEQLLHDTTK